MPGPVPWPRPLTPRRRQHLTHEIEEELAFHLAMRAEDNRRAGMAEAEAEEAAQHQFGNAEQIADACMRAEENHPLRVVKRWIGLGAVLTLGFGALALAFGLLHAVLVQPLRFQDGDQLVRLGEGWDDARVPYDEFVVWRAEATTFERLTTFDATLYTLTEPRDPQRVRAMRTDAEYFGVFGVEPVLGRTFRADEVEAHAKPVVLLSEALWASRYRRSPLVVGRTLPLDGIDHTILGVMPEEAQLSHVVDLWTPLPIPVDGSPRLSSYAVGRLQEGHTLADARADLARIADGIEAAGSTAEPVRQLFHPLHALYAEPVRPLVLGLFMLGVILLLVVWGLAFQQALSRAAAQNPYVETSRALVWGESLGVALVAAVLGLALARGLSAETMGALLGRWGPMFGRGEGVRMLVVLGLALATGASLALAPHIHTVRPRLRVRSWGIQGLSIVTVAASVVLMVAFAQTAPPILKTLDRPLGFDEEHVINADVVLAPPTEGDTAARYARMVEQMAAIPGVERVSLSLNFPYRAERLLSYEVGVEGGSAATAGLDVVGPEYVGVMGLPLLDGRTFSLQDGPDSAPVAMVNAAFAERAWPGEVAVGRTIDVGQDGTLRTVVGVVEDLRYFGVEHEAPAVVYVPHAQLPYTVMSVVVRSSMPPSSLRLALRDAVRAVEPTVALADPQTGHSLRQAATRQSRAILWVFGLSALLALVCAVAGTVHLVSTRIHDQASWIERARLQGGRPRLLVLVAWRPALIAVGWGVVLGLGVAHLLSERAFPAIPGAVEARLLAVVGVVAIVALLGPSLVAAWRALQIRPRTVDA